MLKVAESMTVTAAGIDTWSPAWYVESRSLDDALASLKATSLIHGPGGCLLVPDSIDGHRVGWYPGNGLLFAEGHPSDDGLAPGAALQDRLASLEVGLSDFGLHMKGARWAGVRRLDTTADVRFEDPIAGIATMQALGSLQFPRCKVETIRGVGSSMVETVLLKGRAGRKTLGRMYDKGVESGEAAAGVWSRFEDQRRMNKENRWGITELTGQRVHETFQKRFLPLYQATKGVTVAGPLVIAETLARKIDAGEITPAEAIRIAGYTMLETTGADLGARSTRYRRRAEARKAGVYSDSSMRDELASVEVDVSAVLEAVLESEHWGVG